MDKNAIKTFAIESRRKMIESVKYQASLIGITADGISEPISKAEGMETYDFGAGTHTIYDEDISKRKNLVKEIKNKGFDNVVEEVAYTWFNRIIAIRYMEVNDYLPTRTRVLSSEIEGKTEPDIITEALDIDLNYTQEDKDLIFKFKEENKLDDLFQFLFIKQSTELNSILPGLFEKTDNYIELLLDISFTSNDGVVRNLINSIPEEYFGEQVEIMGWLYQFYNSELKDETFKDIKKNKVSKERIPAVTQLFTPSWIVKYMVENSLGRLWLDNHPNENLKSKWNFYIDDVNQVDFDTWGIRFKNESEILKPENIKIIDPCMGSGHILVYIFEVLMDIYISEGYTEKDASISIIENNLHGLDIDKRAYQIAYFAVLMKAKKYDHNILKKGTDFKLCSIEESNSISDKLIEELLNIDESIEGDLNYLKDCFFNAKEFGSILKLEKHDFNKLLSVIDKFSKTNNLHKFKYLDEIHNLKNLIDQFKILASSYDVVITNPPYLNSRGMNTNLKKYLNKYYSNSKYDLFAVFIEKCNELCKNNKYISLITQHSFMFLSTYENLRIDFINKNTLVNMVHLGARAFDEIGGEVVQTTSFVQRKNKQNNYISNIVRLVDYNSSCYKKNEFFNKENYYLFNLDDINIIPGKTIAYWVDKSIFDLFSKKTISNYGFVGIGMRTGDNKRFLRYWHEINITKFSDNCDSYEDVINNNLKWIPYNKGGKSRKWYGNQEYVVNWENNGYEIKENTKLKYPQLGDNLGWKISNEKYYFKKSITWSFLGSTFGVRFLPNGHIFDTNGSSLFIDDKYYYYVGGFLCSKISVLLLSILNSTMSFTIGNVKSLPLIIDETLLNEINTIVQSNISFCKNDWDDYETSWNFVSHPFIKFYRYNNLKEIFSIWEKLKIKNFNILKDNEMKLNKIFSRIYNINTTSNIDDDNIAITLADYTKDVKSFISYAIGCIFGRYSLDSDGLVYAGGNFNISEYSRFIPDDDNIVPVLDTEYFDDDVVGRFVEFVKVCFGEETLEENLDFIAGALKKKGKTSREIIRNYFLTDFFKDHAKMYKKCPIYWQFDSGKQNAFKCLIYMHRYEPDLVARVRTDYLHKTQKAIEQNLAHCENIIKNSSNKSEISKGTKDKSKYIKQLDEIKTYDEALRHMANQNIEIDLDDGVKVNYAKFQNVEISKEGEKTKKINLLKKI